MFTQKYSHRQQIIDFQRSYRCPKCSSPVAQLEWGRSSQFRRESLCSLLSAPPLKSFRWGRKIGDPKLHPLQLRHQGLINRLYRVYLAGDKDMSYIFQASYILGGETSLSSFVVITSDHPGLEGIPEISLQVKPEGGKVNHNQLELLETANTSSSLLTLYLLQ